MSDERWQRQFRQLRNDVDDVYKLWTDLDATVRQQVERLDSNDDELRADLVATVRRLGERLDRMESQLEERLDGMDSRSRAVRPWAQRIAAAAAAVAVLSSAAAADDEGAEVFDHHSIKG